MHLFFGRKPFSLVVSAVLALALALGPTPCAAWGMPGTDDADGGGEARSAEELAEEGDAGETLAAAVSAGAAVPDELVVVLEPDASAVASERDLSGLGADSDAEIERLSDDALVVRADSSEQAVELADELSQDDRVAYVQPNYVYTAPEDLSSAVEGTSGGAAEVGATLDGSAATADARATSVNDPSWPRQSYLRTVGFDEAWDSVRTDRAVTVAVLDSTVNVSHEDLAGTLVLEHAWDAAAQAPYGSNPAKDHGTMVAGILSAACDNGLGIAGASFGANVLPVNVYQDSGSRLTTTTTVLLRAMEHVFAVADANPQLNVRVVNMSLGGYGSGVGSAVDRAFRDCVSEAVYERGMAVVASGGNENTTEVSWPADWDEVVSVASVDSSCERRAWFSDHNGFKDIAAPGEGILGTAAGGDDAYADGSGTSYSAPIVSAALALVFSADGSLTPQEAEGILYDTATDLGAPGRDDEFGWGLLNVEAAVEKAIAESGNISRAYQDVDQSAWYQTPVAYIDNVVGSGIMVGYDGLFRPDDVMTRAEAFTIAYRMAGAGSADEAPAANETAFADNEGGQFYTAAVNWAAAQGIARGHDGLVRPYDVVTREELAVIMARWVEAVRGTAAVGSPDSLAAAADGGAVSDWALSSMAWAYENGVMTGRVQPDGSALLAPRASVTRAEVAKVVTLVLGME